VVIASYILPSERPISRAQVQWRDDRDASQPSREQVSYARCIPWVGEGRWQAARDVAGQRNAQHHSRERRLRPDARDAGSPRPAVTEPAIVPRVRARSNMRVADRRSPVRRCTEVLTACPWSDSRAGNALRICCIAGLSTLPQPSVSGIAKEDFKRSCKHMYTDARR
jgi:hypothetical protein